MMAEWQVVGLDLDLDLDLDLVTVSRKVTLTGVEPMRVDFSTAGRSFVPDTAELVYRRRGDERWRVYVTIQGQKLKKNGSPAAGRGDAVYDHWAFISDRAPKWVQTMARELTPDV